MILWKEGLKNVFCKCGNLTQTAVLHVIAERVAQKDVSYVIVEILAKSDIFNL
jgi:hypothetical protein